jgi:uncharacterized protein
MRRALLVLLGLCLVLPSLAQESLVRERYTKREEYITMRDGVRLFTSIYIPKDTTKPAPFLMMRTPYSCRPYGPDAYRASLGPEGQFVNEGYIFVYQDVRGRFMSEGDFAWMRPYKPVKGPLDTDETTDTYDTIEWLVKNIPNNNGRLGVYGTSYPGHYASQCLIDPHPALKAAAPQAPMADNWLGDDMYHNGAFFLPHAMNFISGFGKKREGPTQDYGPRVFQHGTQDGYRFWLDLGPVKNSLTRYNMDQIELWKLWITNPTYNAYWQPQNVPQHLRRVGDVAVITVGGWWDAEDLQGPLWIYREIERNNPRTVNTIVMGPWYHGSWNAGDGTSLHDIAWTTKTGVDYRDRLQRPFFRYWLWQDAARPNIPEAMMFDVGGDRWHEFDQWPPSGTSGMFLTFASGGGLERKAAPALTPEEASPRASGGPANDPGGTYDEYVSDPARPVPSSATMSVGMPRSYLIEDQRFVWNRPDVLSYETEPLEHDVTLAGPIKATLYVATSGSDADFIMKLIDVFPDDYRIASPRQGAGPMGGYQMLIRGEPMRAKYRKSWTTPEPLPRSVFSGPTQRVQVERVEFSLPDVMHTFKKGHRIMVQVQSSWFPVVDRNPQTFVENIFFADESDFQRATHRVYTSGSTQSGLRVNVLR